MKKIVVAILCILLLTPAFTSCASQDIYVDDIQNDDPLTIYLINNYDDNISEYIVNYEKGGRDIEITWFRPDEIEAMYKRIQNEVTAGNGPDLIFIDPYTSCYMNLYKMGGLADMDRLIANSESFDMDDYNQMVMDAGILNETRVMIPLCFMTYYLVGDKDVFDYHNIKIPDELTMDDFLHMLQEFYQNVVDTQAIYGVPPKVQSLSLGRNDWMEATYLYPQFIEMGELLENNNELKELVDILKMEYVRKQSHNEKYINEYYSNFCNSNSIIISIGDRFTFKGVRFSHDFMTNYLENEMVLFKQPLRESIDGNKAYIHRSMAININSKHKNEAFLFIEHLLSENIQSDIVTRTGLPVRNEVYNKHFEQFKNERTPIASNDDPSSEEHMPETMRGDFLQFVESIDTCEYIGDKKYIYFHIMWPSIEGYYNDLLTFDEMIDEINNKLEIYYTE